MVKLDIVVSSENTTKQSEKIIYIVKSPSLLSPGIIGVQCDTSTSCALKKEEMER